MLDGLSKPKQIAQRCAKLGYKAAAITDHGTISGAVQFTKECKKAGIKPILGCEFYITKDEAANVRTKDNRKTNHILVLAKNLQGWKQLIKLVSRSNDDDVYYHRPRIDYDILDEFADGNLICISGHMGSDLADVLFTDSSEAYGAGTEEEARALREDDWKDRVADYINKMRHMFGEDNFFIEIQAIDRDNSPCANVIVDCLRIIEEDIFEQTDAMLGVATADSHYPTREDADDHRVLICSQMGTTLKKVRDKMDRGEDAMLGGFFRSNCFHIPSAEEIAEVNELSEMQTACDIADMCEEYSILGEPILPDVECPGEMTPYEYMTDLCRAGWRAKLAGKVAEDKIEEYTATIKKELGVIKKAGLSSYFLVVKDILDFLLANGYLAGPGRGSAAGCLISYLLGITKVDPVKYGLIFERFYNEGRNTDGHVSLPDIDIDMPTNARMPVIQHMRRKYGEKKVGQMSTFNALQGKSALKEVLRVNSACSADEMNKITKDMPGKEAISDQLREMEDPSILMWCLENIPDTISAWCSIDKDGKLQGRFAKYFEQAIRIEGTFKSLGKHPAGVVISLEDLDTICPMLRESRGLEKLVGFQMEDAEEIGLTKYDALAVRLFDKMATGSHQLETGEFE